MVHAFGAHRTPLISTHLLPCLCGFYYFSHPLEEQEMSRFLWKVGWKISKIQNSPFPDNEDICLEDVDPGPCQYYQVQWFWDQQVEECKEFHYGGCMGTKNRFSSKQQCVKQCKYKMFNPVAVPGREIGCSDKEVIGVIKVRTEQQKWK